MVMMFDNLKYRHIQYTEYLPRLIVMPLPVLERSIGLLKMPMDGHLKGWSLFQLVVALFWQQIRPFGL
jgi:hypothetical protein